MAYFTNSSCIYCNMFIVVFYLVFVIAIICVVAVNVVAVTCVVFA